MSKTIRDLLNDLKKVDEVTLMELLDISSTEIVDRFEDIVEARYDQIHGFLYGDDEDEDELPF